MLGPALSLGDLGGRLRPPVEEGPIKDGRRPRETKTV
jgi:hypothetical protein